MDADEWWEVNIPNRSWNSQNFRRRSTSETIHLNPGSSGTRRGTRSSSGRIRRTLFSIPTSSGSSTRWCWSITGDFICRHHVEHRVKLYIPREESFPIPLKCIDVTRTTHTSLDVLLEKHVEDYWNVNEDRELSETWTGFTRFVVVRNKMPRIFMVGERRPTIKTPTMCGQICGSICLMHQNAKRSESVTIEKPKFDNARKLRAFFFIEPEDEDFKSIMKNVRRKLEIPVLAAMPCKTPINSGGETCCGIGKHRTKYACVVEADESKRIRLEGDPWRYHEDHIAAKGTY